MSNTNHRNHIFSVIIIAIMMAVLAPCLSNAQKLKNLIRPKSFVFDHLYLMPKSNTLLYRSSFREYSSLVQYNLRTIGERVVKAPLTYHVFKSNVQIQMQMQQIQEIQRNNYLYRYVPDSSSLSRHHQRSLNRSVESSFDHMIKIYKDTIKESGKIHEEHHRFSHTGNQKYERLEKVLLMNVKTAVDSTIIHEKCSIKHVKVLMELSSSIADALNDGLMERKSVVKSIIIKMLHSIQSLREDNPDDDLAGFLEAKLLFMMQVADHSVLPESKVFDRKRNMELEYRIDSLP